VSKILKRPMFRRGGPANDGIMTGLVDRTKHADNPFVTGIGKRTDVLAPEFETILDKYTPKTKLPIGELGLNLASGMSFTDALRDPYKRFTTADDAREAAVKTGAAKLALGQAMKEAQPSDKRSQIALKAREAFGNKNIINPTTGKPFASYGEAYTYFSMSAADPGRRSIPGDVERSKQNFIAQGTYGDNEVLAERHAIANTIVKAAVSKDENYTGKRIKIDKKTKKYKTEGEAPGIYVDVVNGKIIEINPDGTTEERLELTAILQSYR
tara:strand:- start:44 stop:850 length:807 start_codon:yes stop_codon:yes gene_type:complete